VPEFVFGGDGMDGEGGIPNNVLNSEAKEDDFEAPAIDEVVTDIKLGDLFEIGPHRLLCGDSTNREDVARLMGGEKADMVFTDPPYGVDYDGGIQFSNGVVKKGQRSKLKNDHNEDIYSGCVPIIQKITDGPVYMWFADTKAETIYREVSKVGDVHALLIWVKNGGYGALNASYKQKHEPCLFWKPKGGRLNFVGATTETTVWEINKDGRNEFHPTQKPVALAARAIGNHSGELVADIFLGSGTTMVAAHQLNRKCYGMEIDPKYCQVIVNRMAKLDPSLEIKRNGEPYNPK
jgi:DNA modification methylase